MVACEDGSLYEVRQTDNCLGCIEDFFLYPMELSQNASAELVYGNHVATAVLHVILQYFLDVQDLSKESINALEIIIAPVA
jgi:hypothetical protein